LRPLALPLVALSLLACGSSNTRVNPVEGDASVVSDAPAEVAIDVGPPIEAVYEISYFRLGVTTRDGEESTDAWKQFGFDLDGICTTEAQSETSEGTCIRDPKSKINVLADGDDCIDNNFGSQLVPLVKILGGDIEKNLVDGIKKGGATLALQLRDLSPVGADDSVPGALFAAKSATGAAAFDGTDVMDVDESSVADKDLSRPIAVLEGRVELVAGKRVWKGKAATMALPVVFLAGATGAIPVRDVRLEFDLESRRGSVGGYSLVTDITTIVNAILAKNKICPGNIIYESTQANVAQAADMPELLPHDTTKGCASISLGLGFELSPATLGKVYPTPAPPANPCAK
jgi:hypothetical protein